MLLAGSGPANSSCREACLSGKVFSVCRQAQAGKLQKDTSHGRQNREEDLQTGHQEVLRTKIQVAGKLHPRQDIFCVAGKLKSPASFQQESRILPLHVSSLGAREGRPDIFPGKWRIRGRVGSALTARVVVHRMGQIAFFPCGGDDFHTPARTRVLAGTDRLYSGAMEQAHLMLPSYPVRVRYDSIQCICPLPFGSGIAVLFYPLVITILPLW